MFLKKFFSVTGKLSGFYLVFLFAFTVEALQNQTVSPSFDSRTNSSALKNRKNSNQALLQNPDSKEWKKESSDGFSADTVEKGQKSYAPGVFSPENEEETNPSLFFPEKSSLLSFKGDDSPDYFDKDKEVFTFSGKVNFDPYMARSRSWNDILFRTKLYGKVYWSLFDNLSVQTEGLLLGRKGSIQSVYGKEYRREGFNFLEFFFNYNYNSRFEIKFGVLNQDFLKAPLLMTDRTFPALQESFSFFLPKNITGRFVFQQAIPNNADDDVKRASQLTPLPPLFFTGSAFLETKSHPYLFNSNVRERLTFFYFTRLPSSVADQKGRIYGNSILNYGSDAGFLFDFYGIHNTLSWRIPFKDSWAVELEWDYLHNFGAESSFNKGGRYRLSLYHDFFNLIEFKLTGEVFGNQSDSSVAFYNSEIYGHNNRQGAGLILQGHFYQSGVTVGGRYLYARPIEGRRTSLEGSHYFSIYIRTSYVSII